MASVAASSSLTPALQLNAPTNSPKSQVFFPRSLPLDTGSSLWAKHRSNASVIRAATSATAPPKFKTLTPLGDRLLVKIQKPNDTTPGGLILPLTSQNKPQGGEVIAVGSGKTIANKKLDPSVSVGDMVVYSKYAGTEVQFNNEEHLLLKEDDVIGFLSTDDIKDLKPLNERVLIKVAKAEEKTSGGIILTESAKEKPVTGTVIAVGSGMFGEDGEKKPLDVSAGNSVMYTKYAGNDFKSKDGTEYVVIRASDILAVLP